MPVSEKPRKPFRGNKVLLHSQEYHELAAAIGVIANQIARASALLALLDARLKALEPQAVVLATPEERAAVATQSLLVPA